MTTPDLAQIPVRSPLALTRRWVALLAPPLFDRRSLWLTWLGPDARQTPVLLPIDDVPARPDDRLLRGVLDLHREVGQLLGDGIHLALALCRPGEALEHEDDTAWTESLRALLDAELDGTWSLHLAAGGRVHPLVEAPSAFPSAPGTGGPR